MVKFRDYYEILGVSRSATDKEIKAAYRKLARLHHPDANKGNKASEEKFKEINEAYEVLKDAAKRRRYDTLGANYKNGADFRPPPDAAGGSYTFDFGNMGEFDRHSPFSDFFDMLFGQHMGAGATTFRTPPGAGMPNTGPKAPGRRLDQEAEIELTIEELAHGTKRTLQITEPGATTRTLEVKIPKGMRAGSKVRVSGEGGKAMGGQTSDLYLKVKVKPHNYFTIDGDNLICEITLTPAQAVIGSEAVIDTLEGPVRIKIPAGTQSGRLLRLRDRGLPKVKGEQRGDLLARAKIVVPATVSPQEKLLYERLLALEKERSAAAPVEKNAK